MKEKIKERVESLKEELLELSHKIHKNPEIAYEEHKAVAFIKEVLEKHGFVVEQPYAGLETAFKAVKKGKKEGPIIAFLAEYDALPEIGHACGHNIIATCSVGAFLSLAPLIDGLAGEIRLIGTPAEESGGGKIQILENGGFEGVEYALMMHPSSGEKGLVNRGGRAATSVYVEFFGKSAHSAGPQAGINALNALIATFNNIDLMRPSLHPSSNINGIITKGGSAANAIPDYAAATFSLRSATLIELEKLSEAVIRCAKAAELLVGARLETKVSSMYAERYPNWPMCEAFKDNMESLGQPMAIGNPQGNYGSSDIGNVSIVIPSIHDYLPACPAGVNSHNIEYTKCTDQPMADNTCILGAKGLGMTALDILTQPELRGSIYDYFEEQIPAEYKNK
ncbi:MAG: M20 family metallopeptidase [Firmicutes bacterium]|jgi:amidohydrolase|nr:M20 family metallopeptidase [Bacillota bacterium]